MELQFEKQEMEYLRQALGAVKDQELTQEIRLTDAMPDVGRVLAGWGQPVLRSKEWQGSQIGASGGVMVWSSTPRRMAAIREWWRDGCPSR